MRISKLYAPHISEKIEVETPANIPTHKLLERTDLADYEFAGTYSLLPLGVKVIRKLENLLKQKSEEIDLQEFDLPLIQPRFLWEKSGRLARFSNEIINTGRRFDNYILTPTNEEFATNLVRHGVNSYKKLPLHIYQIGEVFKGNTPSKGLIRSIAFEVYEAYSFNKDQKCLENSAKLFSNLFEQVFKKLELDIKKFDSSSGDYTNYLLLSDDGEHKVLSCDKGHIYEYKPEVKNELCEKCDSRLNERRGLSIAMYKMFDDNFSKLFNLRFATNTGKQEYPFMGTYGLGISRLFYSIVDQHHDDKGILWPSCLAPFNFCVIPIDSSKAGDMNAAEHLYNSLTLINKGEVLFDDRLHKRVEGKKRSINLIGIPHIITVSTKDNKTNFVMEIRSKNINKNLSLEGLINYIKNEGY